MLAPFLGSGSTINVCKKLNRYYYGMEKSKEYFNIKFSPFMLRVTKSKKKNIPSALHVDNTARVQTVNKKQNRRFYSIINEFYKQTNVPD